MHFVVNAVEEDTGTSMDVISTSTQLILESLHPFYFYLISISAVTILPGPYTTEIRVQTLEDGMLVIHILFLSPLGMLCLILTLHHMMML